MLISLDEKDTDSICVMLFKKELNYDFNFENCFYFQCEICIKRWKLYNVRTLYKYK